MQSPLQTSPAKRPPAWALHLAFLAIFATISRPAYACADVGAGLLVLGGIIFVALFGPLLLGGLLVAACDKIKFSGYGLLLGAATFVIVAPVCMSLVFHDVKGEGMRLLLMVTPGLLSTLCILVMSLRETMRRNAALPARA